MKKSKWKSVILVESILLRVSIFCFGLLLISQTLLVKEGTRIYLSKVDKLEGEHISLDGPFYAGMPLTITDNTVVTNRLQSLRPSKVIIIRMIKPAGSQYIYATVNGQVMGDFRHGDIKLTVYDGDYVEIDATLLKESAQFVIHVPGTELISPVDGLVLESNGTVASVGKIKFRT